MRTEPGPRVSYLAPGYVVVPAAPTTLAVSVASGIAVSVYDQRRQSGGMCHYVWPYRQQFSAATSAAPAIVSLVRLLTGGGSCVSDLEAYIYGGSVSLVSRRYQAGLSEINVKVGVELLKRLRIPLLGRDVGGTRGRRVVFFTGTGETLIGRFARVDEAEWYPALAH